MTWLREWRRRRQADRLVIRAKGRLELLSASDAADWADTSIYDLGRGLTTWRSLEDPTARLDALNDACLSAEILLVIVEDIRDRQARRLQTTS